jgi:hypothetical protein
MKLVRNEYSANGIFGTLNQDDGTQVAVTLEHAYLQPDGSYAPKTPAGVYTCVKGLHTLEHTPVPFDAFEITNVPGHTNILIHIGNYNADSEGCCLIGDERVGDMIVNSKITFLNFMNAMATTDSFILTVS